MFPRPLVFSGLPSPYHIIKEFLQSYHILHAIEMNPEKDNLVPDESLADLQMSKNESLSDGDDKRIMKMNSQDLGPEDWSNIKLVDTEAQCTAETTQDAGKGEDLQEYHNENGESHNDAVVVESGTATEPGADTEERDHEVQLESGDDDRKFEVAVGEDDTPQIHTRIETEGAAQANPTLKDEPEAETKGQEKGDITKDCEDCIDAGSVGRGPEEAADSKDIKPAAEAPERKRSTHVLEKFRGHYTRVQSAMDMCRYDLEHLLRNTEPIHLKPEDFTLPTDLCEFTLDFIRTVQEYVRVNKMDQESLEQLPQNSDTFDIFRDLTRLQSCLVEAVERPLTLVYYYVDAWRLRVVDLGENLNRTHILDPSVRTPERIEIEAFQELMRQYNELHNKYVQVKAQLRSQPAESNSPEDNDSWEWQQATRVCAACRKRFERQSKDAGKGEAPSAVCGGRKDSVASSRFVSIPFSQNGEPFASADAKVAGLMNEMTEHLSGDSDTFDEEQAKLLQQEPYASPVGIANCFVDQAQGEPEILQPTPRYSTAQNPAAVLEANSNPPWLPYGPEAGPQPYQVADHPSSVTSVPEGHGLHPAALSSSERGKRYDELFAEKLEQYQALTEMYEDLAERFDNQTKLYGRSAKRYHDLTERFQELTDRHEEIKKKFETERMIHDQVTSAFVTNAVEVEWTQNLSKSERDARSISPPVSPRGTVFSTPLSKSLDTTDTRQQVDIEGRIEVNGDFQSQRPQSDASSEPVAPAAHRQAESLPESQSMVGSDSTAVETTQTETQVKVLSPEVTAPLEGQSLHQCAQIQSFSEFVEVQCHSWVTICDFLLSFIIPIPRPPILVADSDDSALTDQVSRCMNHHYERAFPWPAMFNILTQLVLLFGIQTWIACAEERDSWLYANNVRPTTLLLSYANGERSVWPGLHGGLLTGGEANLLLWLVLSNSSRVLELLCRAAQGLNLGSHDSMRVLMLGALVLMIVRFG
ncbi:hypothetical protein VFPPC_04675 [Pochonia chlamydosporia 170]|uniref:Uncharacterized protein n=1 Tax=Pochonia chlamydosporia 170 TaxID=1380566 RepID=A0A179FSV3_METCM|nr:hypothetical protein VFPPC_04675 [Pochonia chlamydosporia 170]OAQ68437.1 hypothetical protein VFPPC_04675 [Pochonia chlamydosporia 170]